MPRINPDAAKIILGASLETRGNFNLRVDYSGEFRNGYQNQNGIVRASRAF